MEMVVKIPDDMIKSLEQGNFGAKYNIHDLVGYLMNGTPLPKGHGRLLDENDILDTDNNDGGWYDLVDMPEYIKGVKEIIEADKEGRGE